MSNSSFDTGDAPLVRLLQIGSGYRFGSDLVSWVVIPIPVTGLFALSGLIDVDSGRGSAYATAWWRKPMYCPQLWVMAPSVSPSQIESFVEDIEDLQGSAAAAGRNTCCIWSEKESQ